ncbi:MAG TPA: hypothetical protein VFO58_05025 [Vicinamibacterales bacterium]|nr:hypothetical protein [Vicinamibacterales bacterium]
MTTDKNLKHQQDLSKRSIAIIVIGHAQWRGLEAHVHLVVAAIDRAAKGSYDEVEIPVG